MSEILLNKEKLKRFILLNSWNNCISGYFLFLAHVKKIPFSLKVVCEEMGWSYDYAHSNIINLNSLGLITYKRNKELYIIIEFNDVFASVVSEYVIEKANRNDGKEVKEDLKWMNDVVRVNEYFK